MCAPYHVIGGRFETSLRFEDADDVYGVNIGPTWMEIVLEILCVERGKPYSYNSL